MSSTRIELVEMLQEAKKTNTANAAKIDRMKSMAQKGYYHDYDSPLPFPKLQLHKDLMDLGLDQMAIAVTENYFDDQPDDKDKLNLDANIIPTFLKG